MTLQKDPEKREARYLRRAVDVAGKSILEVGCGDGRLTWQYAREASQVACMDLDPDRLRLALIDRPSDPDERVTFCHADSVHLPYPGDQFDVAILAWSF